MKGILKKHTIFPFSTIVSDIDHWQIFILKRNPTRFHPVLSSASTKSQICNSVSSHHQAALKHYWCISTAKDQWQKEIRESQITTPSVWLVVLTSKGTHSNDTRYIKVFLKNPPNSDSSTSWSVHVQFCSEFCHFQISHEMK